MSDTTMILKISKISKNSNYSLNKAIEPKEEH